MSSRQSVESLEPGLVLNPRICFGKPVVKGTRIPASLIARLLKDGTTIEEICDLYWLSLEREDVEFVAKAEELFRLRVSDSLQTGLVYVPESQPGRRPACPRCRSEEVEEIEISKEPVEVRIGRYDIVLEGRILKCRKCGFEFLYVTRVDKRAENKAEVVVEITERTLKISLSSCKVLTASAVALIGALVLAGILALSIGQLIEKESAQVEQSQHPEAL